MKTIEIVGGGVINKGAEMMLRAVIKRLHIVFGSEVRIVAPPTPSLPYINRAKLGMYQALWAGGRKPIDFLYTRLTSSPRVARRRQNFGIILENEIDAVIDISGYLYSSAFGLRRMEANFRHYREIARLGRPVILMPQAYGPFSANQERFRRFFEIPTAIYYRDKESARFLRELIGEKAENIKEGPDFTSDVKPTVLPDFDILRNTICIIPNARMLDKTSAGNQYIEVLASLIKALKKANKPMVFAIWGGGEDRSIADTIMKMASVEVPTFESTDVSELKGLVSSCEAVIGSRFHGLVAALDGCVPSIALGWSHKYAQLFSDYGISEYICPIPDNQNLLAGMIEKVLKDDAQTEIRSSLKVKAQEKRLRVDAMWSDLAKVIDAS